MATNVSEQNEGRPSGYVGIHGDTIIIAVVAIFALVVATIVGLEIFRPDKDSTPLITAVIGFATPTIIGLVALLKLDTQRSEVRQLKRDVANGMQDVAIKTAAETVTPEKLASAIKLLQSSEANNELWSEQR